MIYWIIVDRDNPRIETAWTALGRLQLINTKEAGEGHLVQYFGRKRQEEKIVVPVSVEIVSETALGPIEEEEE